MENRKLQPYFLLLLLIGAMTLAFFILRPFLAPLVLAAVFATVLYPLYQRVRKHFISSESGAAFFTLIVGAVCLLVPLWLLGGQIFKESQSLYASLAAGGGIHYFISAEAEIERLIGQTPVLQNASLNLSAGIDAYAKQVLSWLIQNIGSTFSSIASLLMSTFVFLMALFFLLRDGTKLKRMLIELSPLADTDDEKIFNRLKLATNSVIKGSLTVACIQGVLTGIGFTLFGVPNSVLWGTVAVFSALIPGIGTSLVLVPGIFFLFLTGHTFDSAGLLLWALAGVGLVDNFLGPKLVSRGMQLHPLLTLLSVLGGIAFFGPIGIFLGPLSMSVLFALLSIYADPAGAHRE